MKKKPFLLTILLLSSTLIICCNDNSDQSKTGSMDAETINNPTMNKEQLTSFGKKYAEAWCSQKPGEVAAFFSTKGSLKVNTDTPAVGREAITRVARGFMTAFPDMIVAMDSLVTKPNRIEFHWTLTGTNSGPGGTGNKVKISGMEVWTFVENKLIQESIGSFDADEYNRQLKEGVK